MHLNYFKEQYTMKTELKIYKNTGGLDDEGVKSVLMNCYLQDHIATQGASIFNNTCKQRYHQHNLEQPQCFVLFVEI